MDDSYKEVYFGEYCKLCKHEKLSEDQDPCDECLASPANLYSHKPIKFESKTKKEIKR